MIPETKTLLVAQYGNLKESERSLGLSQEALQEGGPEDKLRAALRSFVADLAEVVEDGAGHFDSVNVATCLHDLVAVTSSAPPHLSDALIAGAVQGTSCSLSNPPVGC